MKIWINNNDFRIYKYKHEWIFELKLWIHQSKISIHLNHPFQSTHTKWSCLRINATISSKKTNAFNNLSVSSAEKNFSFFLHAEDETKRKRRTKKKTETKHSTTDGREYNKSATCKSAPRRKSKGDWKAKALYEIYEWSSSWWTNEMSFAEQNGREASAAGFFHFP